LLQLNIEKDLKGSIKLARCNIEFHKRPW